MMPAPANQQRSPQEVFELTKKYLTMGDYHEAAKLAGQLRSHFPDQTPILAVHGLTMAAVGAHAIAIPDLQRAAHDSQDALDNGDPENPSRPRIVDQLLRVRCELAASHEALGQTEQADEAIKLAAELDPEAPEVVLTQIRLLCGRGNTDAAQKVLDEANELGLEELPAAQAAATIALSKPATTHDETHVLAQRLRALADRVGLDAATQSRVLRTAAALFDRSGEYDEAFRAFTRAANFTRGSFDASDHAAMTNAVLKGWPASSMAKVSRPTTENSNRVFVVGAAHSGSAELAQALTGHPEVADVGPMDPLTLAAARKAGARPTKYRPVLPDCAKLRRDQLEGAAGIYTRQCDFSAFPRDRRVTVDPSTLQAHLIGLGALALPGATFVFVRREPRSHALACYFHGVPGHHPYVKELATVASYIRDIDRTLDHWHAALSELGIKVVETTREALAADPAGETNRIAEACGLEPAATLTGPVFPHSPADHPDKYAKRTASIEPLLPAPRA